MIASRITRRYAKALFNMANEKNLLDRISEDLKLIKNVCDESDDFIRLVDSPVIQISEKRQVFSQLFENKVHSLSYYFFQLLLEKNRENFLPDIIQHFMNLIDESKGILRGHLLSAFPLTEKQFDSLKSRLNYITGKKVILDQKVDTALLGGFIVTLQDTVIDTSIKNQLTKIRDRMISGE